MRNHEVDAKGKAAGGSAAANGAVSSKRRKRRSWGLEDKIRVARESFATDETVASVARRYGISRYRLSSWRSLLRRGKLVAPSSAQAGAAGAFAAVEVEERPSVVIEGGGVTVRLEGGLDGAGIAAIAVALAGTR